MGMAGLKPILLLTIFWLFAAWVFVIIATAVVDWSKGPIVAYGIWKICAINDSDLCSRWDMTEEPFFKDCEGALMATQAFSVISIVWTFFCLCLVVLFLIKPTMMKKSLLLVNICMIGLNVLWTFLGWVMYLGVEARGHCVYHDYDSRLGSSWFLQLFAWIFSMVAAVLAVLLFMKWKKTPKYYTTPAVGPVPYAAAGGMYPQYKSPYGAGYPPPAYKDPYYPYGPMPYYPYAGPAAPYPAYPPAFGTTPSTSPYQPSPYY